MKEAAGEANITVITIVLIGVVAAAGALIIPRLLDNTARKSACSELGGTLSGTSCTYKDFSTDASGVEKTVTCTKTNGEWACGE